MDDKRNIIICPVGLNGSGKGSFCKILAERHGFISLSTSDVIRDILFEKGLPVTRENMGKTANGIRSEKGKEYFTRYLSQTMNLESHSYVVDGCRQVEEISFLQNRYPRQVFVVLVYCDAKIRFERMKARNRVGDPETFEDFLIADEIELGNVTAPNTMNYKECFDLVEYKVDNSSGIENFQQEVSELISKIMI